MIEQYLRRQHAADRLHNCYLFSSDDLARAQTEIEAFARELLGVDSLQGCSDFLVVKKLDNKVKNISVDQIRSMQDFLYKSSVLSGVKVAAIIGADEMNVNAANSCLKVLEDTPANTHIFLLVENAASLPETVRSRCIELHCNYQRSNMPSPNSEMIEALLHDAPAQVKHSFIEQFASKDRMLWKKFAHDMELLIARLSYHQNGLPDCKLSELEEKLFAQINGGSMHKKYEQATQIITQTEHYDLELRVSVTLLMNLL